VVLVEANPIAGFGAFVKRSQDIIFGMLLVIMFSWLLFGIAIAIKATSRGPVVFRQERRGRAGIPFRCFKFRSMYVEETDFDSAVQTRANDPRITPVGRFLRKHSLDELPQLVNVIVGHMSLVGPRPHAFGTSLDGRLLHDVMPDYPLRYRVRPGMTGWAQVNGWRGIIDTQDKLKKRVEFDLYYIANWSVSFDLQILFRTFTCLFADERAY
jgi:lipopolysaccharide/colanic/teichoic acid biosynthesis glycosyltransferase